MYVEHLKDFWYTVEVDDATKDISLSLFLFENELLFTRFDFLFAIGLTDSKTTMPLPPKGNVRAGLATLGLADKDKPSLTYTELVNFSPLKLKSVSGFETANSDNLLDNEVSTSDHIVQDNNASAECMILPDHMDHICEEVGFLHSKLCDIESSIAGIKSSLPTLVTNALKEQLPDLLSATLKDCLPLIIKDSLFVTLQKELSKVIRSEVTKKVQVVRLEGLRKDLHSQIKHISKYSSSFQVMQTQLRDVKDLLESAVVIDETAKEEKKKRMKM
nr:hypothetical protein [Tanacetum cinerariifolium]